MKKFKSGDVITIEDLDTGIHTITLGTRDDIGWTTVDGSVITGHVSHEYLHAHAVFTEGVKFDEDKLPYHLIAPELLSSIAEILAFGAKKYAPRNWEKGMAWHRPFRACMDHLWAWWRGAGPDPETGKSHLWHAACCIMFLVAYEARGIGDDDRP